MPSLLSWFFPESCCLCGGPDGGRVGICPKCLSKLERVPRPICTYCGAPVAGEQAEPGVCDECRGLHRHLSFLRSALRFSPEAMGLIHDLKYHRRNHLALALAPLMAETFRRTPELAAHRDWVLVPVPVTRRRLFARGYNQAEELALALGRELGLPILRPLARRETGAASQTRLSAVQRERNARAAYHLVPAYEKGRRVLPPHLLLVDDVMTTGATLRACAGALKRAEKGICIAALTLMRMN